MDRLEGKVTLITGGASGIGRATSLLFAREGATVVIADYAAEAAEATVRDIVAAGGKASFLSVDVAKAADVRRMIDETVAAHGRIDVIFNNAGIEGPAARIADYSEEDWDRVIAIDLTAVFLGIKYVLPQMVKQGGGVIISTASVAGLVGFPKSAAYAAAKAGVINLTRLTAVEYASRGIRANCICPGIIETPMAKRVMGSRAGDATQAMQPIGRTGNPEEIAAAALFLAGDECPFAAGAPFIVDGGYVAR